MDNDCKMRSNNGSICKILQHINQFVKFSQKIWSKNVELWSQNRQMWKTIVKCSQILTTYVKYCHILIRLSNVVRMVKCGPKMVKLCPNLTTYVIIHCQKVIK